MFQRVAVDQEVTDARGEALTAGEGWNQTELAFYAGLAPSVISQIENGKRDPSAGTLRKLATALEVDVGDLFPKTQAPLPFEEVEQEQQWRSPILEAWTRHMNRWVLWWEQALENEEGGAPFREPEVVADRALNLCDLVARGGVEIGEHFIEAVVQHDYLYEAGDLPRIGLPQGSELLEASLAMRRVTQKWRTWVESVWDDAPEDVKPRGATRLGKAAEVCQNATARVEQLLAA